MPFTERDGHQIWYSTHGDAANPPLLLVMGLGVSSSAWDQLPQRLSDRFHVITFDNCGSGRSASPADEHRNVDWILTPPRGDRQVG